MCVATSVNIPRARAVSKNYTEHDRYDVVLANPPFKGSIDKGDINEALELKTTKKELLFVNRVPDERRPISAILPARWRGSSPCERN